MDQNYLNVWNSRRIISYRMFLVLLVALLFIDSPVFFGGFNHVDAASDTTIVKNSSTKEIGTPPLETCANADLFRCPGTGRCIPRNWICDGDNDCGRNEDELNCSAKKCAEDEHRCSNNVKCIPKRWLCDSEDDCGDNSDEHERLCSNRTCASDQFRCTNSSHCIPTAWKCDGQDDCIDASDEHDCNVPTSCGANEFTCKNGRCIFLRWKCDFDDDCGDKSDEEASCNYTCQPGYAQCGDKRCIPDRWICDGEPDCFDHSDELNCNQSTSRNSFRNITCNPKTEFQCVDGPCISRAWKCDGDADCPDGSDELNCPETACTNNEFKCQPRPLICINKALKCNGILECPNGKDEENCTTAPPTREPCDPGTQFDCGNTCIRLNQVCDLKRDCPNGEDELPAINCTARQTTDYCANKPCDPSAICVKGAKRHICICPFGYRPNEEQKRNNKIVCEDIDECELPSKQCTQICHNTPGSYRCGCHGGYTLSIRDRKTCKAMGTHPKLWLSSRMMIREIDLITKKKTEFLKDLDSAVAMDYSFGKKYIFWSDVAHEIIYKFKFPDDMPDSDQGVSVLKGQVKLVEKKLSTPDGMAVDWIHDLVYWTDTGLNMISVINFEGTMRKTLFHSGLDEPRAIALDPKDGVMFWTDWGREPKIETASMDGTNRMTIIKTDIQWPNGLAIDYVDKRIFWVDAKLKMISSADYDGGRRVIVLNSWSSLRHPFSIVVFEEKIYWTDWDTEGVHTVNKYTGNNVGNSSVVAEGLSGPMTIRIYQDQAQPSAYNKCDKSGCEQLCLPAKVVQKGGSRPVPFSCVCADGYEFGSDGSCVKLAEPPGSSDANAHDFEQKSSGAAATAVAVVLCLGTVGACIGFLVWRRMQRSSRSARRLNFENPIYRRTVVDDSNENGGIHYDHLHLGMDGDPIYNPSTDAMHTSNASRPHNGTAGGNGSGVYQPTTMANFSDAVIGVGVAQNGKYSMTLPLTEHEEGSDYA